MLGCPFPDRAKRRRGPCSRPPPRGPRRPRSAAAEPRGAGGRRADGDREQQGSGRLGLAADWGGIGGTGMDGAGRGTAPGVGAVTGSACPGGASRRGVGAVARRSVSSLVSRAWVARRQGQLGCSR